MGFGDEIAGLICESSVVEEFALDVLMVDKECPWRREGGGGGGAFWAVAGCEVGSWLELIGGGSIECCDDMVREELLRDLFPAVEVRSWLCRRASGTGGGTFLKDGVGDKVTSAMLADSLSRASDSDAVSWEMSCEII